MNVLFIFTDQQHRYALGCMDNPNVDTPNLDRLAAKGVLFRRCYSNDPIVRVSFCSSAHFWRQELARKQLNKVCFEQPQPNNEDR